jgi:predicted ATPase/class 3 adenylate cyclase
VDAAATAVGGVRRRDLPSGTVTFLFTDIEGSTRLLEGLGERYAELLARHHGVLRAAFTAEGGTEIATEGDSFFVVFPSAPRAVAACVAAQRALAADPSLAQASLKVRMGLHTGEGVVAVADYVGLDVHRAARVAAAGHGGQVLLTSATRALVDGSLPDGATLKDLGEHRLKDLSRPERIYQLVVPDLPADFPELQTLDRRANNLPVQVTSFIGREHEVAEAGRLLAGTRVLTLTGPGGTGKTRLSLQVAAEASDDFEDGVFFVPLAPIFDANLVPSTVAQELGVQESGSVPLRDRLLDYLGPRQALLVLDNFEQVVAAAPFVGEMLQAAPRLKVLVTTRAVLHVYGEQEFAVPPLRMPDPNALPSLATLSQYEAVALFIQRAVAVKSDFAVTDQNASAVAEICARLDGLPLAIELAAARVKLLPPEAILARLDRSLGLLTSGARDLPARQQTLRGAIAWSHDLLDEPARRLFAQLGVFVGGCALEAADAVCSPHEGAGVLDGLAALVDQSMLRQEEHHGEPRFVMLETIREFALEKLAEAGELEDLRSRHARYFLEFAERAEPQLVGRDQGSWLDWVQDEQGNIRAALDWASHNRDAETALRLAAAVWRFWQIRGQLHEGAERLADALAVDGADRLIRARAKALEAAGGIAYWRARLDESERHYESALQLNRQLDDKSAIARSLYNLAFPRLMDLSPTAVQADPTVTDRSRELLAESLQLYRELDDQHGVANGLWALGTSRFLVNEREQSLSEFAEALEIFRAVGDRFMTGWTLFQLGVSDLTADQFASARSYLTEALTTFAEADDRSGIVLLLDAFGSLEAASGDPERGVRLRGASEALARTSGTELGNLTRRYAAYANPVTFVSAGLAERLLDEGRQMPLKDAIAYALRSSDGARSAGAPSGGDT